VSAQLAVKVHRGADQRQMREGLWEVAELFAGRPDLLGVQAEEVAVGEHLLEDEDRFGHAPGANERLCVPERWTPNVPKNVVRPLRE
jgi:hypothetical protein